MAIPQCGIFSGEGADWLVKNLDAFVGLISFTTSHSTVGLEFDVHVLHPVALQCMSISF